MIHRYSHDHLRRWNNGEHQVRIDVPGRQLPMGYCDGSDDDEQELRHIAEAEGLEGLSIQKRLLKTGRQIWTVGGPPEVEFVDDDD